MPPRMRVASNVSERPVAFESLFEGKETRVGAARWAAWHGLGRWSRSRRPDPYLETYIADCGDRGLRPARTLLLRLDREGKGSSGR